MVPIPVALTFTTTLSGRLPKLVQCVKCGFEYVYLLESTVAGEGTSVLFVDNEGARQRSMAAAEAQLQQELEHGCEVVPCQACGLVQPHMVPRARHLRHGWMRASGVVALAAAGILTLPAMIYTLIDGTSFGVTSLTTVIWAVVGLVLCAGLGLIFQRMRLAEKYDPNGEPIELRKQMGQELSVSKEEFLKINGAAGA